MGLLQFGGLSDHLDCNIGTFLESDLVSDSHRSSVEYGQSVKRKTGISNASSRLVLHFRKETARYFHCQLNRRKI